jgi:hypothetical protein
VRPDGDQGDAANQADAAHDRRKVNALIFSVLDFERTQLGVFFLGRPMNAAPGKTDNANDNENDADNSSWFHSADATAVAARQSIEE